MHVDAKMKAAASPWCHAVQTSYDHSDKPVGVKMLVLPALEDKYKRKALLRVYTPVSTMLLVPCSCKPSTCMALATLVVL